MHAEDAAAAGAHSQDAERMSAATVSLQRGPGAYPTAPEPLPPANWSPPQLQPQEQLQDGQLHSSSTEKFLPWHPGMPPPPMIPDDWPLHWAFMAMSQ